MSIFALAGPLSKMRVQYSEHGPVQYELVCGEAVASLNGSLGRKICLQFNGQITCVHCGRATRKSFNQGYCYPCFQRLAQCDSCIMAPEKCHFAQGTCREPDWAETHCRVPHVVYLANSTGLKVGITRSSQMPTRWIDQGAAQATPLFRVAERRISGLIEAALREHVTDRTQWQRLLKGDAEPVDLAQAAERLVQQAADALRSLATLEAPEAIQREAVTETRIRYPILEYPGKIKSIDAEKQPRVEGTLLGIKGQYLLLDTGCINIRKYTAYHVQATLE